MWNLLNKEPSYQKYTTNPIDAFLTSKSRAPSSFLWSVLPSQPQPAALQSADQMTKQKPQAVLWRFVAQSRGHKASWQIQKKPATFPEQRCRVHVRQDLSSCESEPCSAKKKAGRFRVLTYLPLLPWLPPLLLPLFSVPICAHGGYRASLPEGLMPHPP